MADEGVLFGFRDIDGPGRVYYETVAVEKIADPVERQQARELAQQGYALVHVFSAGEEPALGAIAPDAMEPLTEAEFIAARDAGWPNAATGGGKTFGLHVGGTMAVTPDRSGE